MGGWVHSQHEYLLHLRSNRALTADISGLLLRRKRSLVCFSRIECGPYDLSHYGLELDLCSGVKLGAAWLSQQANGVVLLHSSARMGEEIIVIERSRMAGWGRMLE